MIKSVKWFFVVLVIGSLISLGFSKESIYIMLILVANILFSHKLA